MPNAQLDRYLERRLDQPTVILCFRILLENVIANGLEAGLRKREIARKFNEESRSFGVTYFRTDYVIRQSGEDGRNALFAKGDIIYIFPEFLEGVSRAEMQEIVNRINARYEETGRERRQLYEEIEAAMGLRVEDRRAFILEMLLNKETSKRGQSFEVTAFAILKVYYSVRGFELNRFSTVYSNDGGIDYTSQTSIYQVTTMMDDKKFESDILKAPLKQRIIVFKRASPSFDYSKMEHELVTDYITQDDLVSHLDYLLSKKPEVNSLRIMQVILSEFQREFYL